MPLRVNHRKHPEASLFIFIAVHPGDGQEVGDLPGEQDAEEGQPHRMEPGSARSAPPDQWWKRAGYRTDQGIERCTFLQRCVDQHVENQAADSKDGGESIPCQVQ